MEESMAERGTIEEYSPSYVQPPERANEIRIGSINRPMSSYLMIGGIIAAVVLLVALLIWLIVKKTKSNFTAQQITSTSLSSMANQLVSNASMLYKKKP